MIKLKLVLSTGRLEFSRLLFKPIFLTITTFKIIFFNSCDKPDNFSSEHKIISQDSLYKSTISFDFGTSEIRPADIKLFSDHNNDEFISFLNAKTKQLFIFSFNNPDYKKIIDLELIKNERVQDYFLRTLDSIIILFEPNHLAIIVPPKNQLISIPINLNSKSLGTDFQLVSTAEFPIYADSMFYSIRMIPTWPINTAESRKKYFSSKLEFCQSPNSELNEEIGYFPASFITGNYYVYNCSRIIANNEHIYSFASEDSLLIFNKKNNNYFKKKIKGSSFIQNDPFDDSKIMDYEYIARYLTEQYWYQGIRFDKYKNCLIRIMKKGMPYRNEDGTVNLWIDCPWSAIVADSSFNIKYEIMFPPAKYDFRTILISEDGLLVKKSSDAKKGNKIIFDLFTLP